MPTRSLKARALIICLALVLAGAVPSVQAGGKPELQLAEAQITEAERLMEQQDYNGALKLLAAIQRSNPDLQDRTNELISEVIIVRGQQYNKVLGELVKALYEEHNEDKAVLLIAELQRIDPARSLGEASGAFDFVRFYKLMDTAAELLAAGKISEALSLYLLPFSDPKSAGFEMQKPDFETAGYGKIITASVQGAVSRILAVGGREVNAVPGIAAVPAAIDPLLAGKAGAEILDAFDTALSPLRETAKAEGEIRATSATLADMNRSIRDTTGKGKEDPYIRYILWLCLGRDRKTEGIARALQLLWQDRARAVADKAVVNATAAFVSARASYDSAALGAADTLFDDAYYRNVLAVKALSLVGATLSTSPTTGGSLFPANTEALQDLVVRASDAQERAAEARAFQKLIRYRSALEGLPVVNPGAVVDPARIRVEAAQLASARATIDARATAVASDEREWRARADAFTTMTSTGFALAPLGRSATVIADLFASFDTQELQPRDLSYALRLARIGGSGYQEKLEAAVALRKQGQDLMAGTRNGELPAGFVGIPPRHPEQALPVFQDAGNLLDALTTDITILAQGLRGDKPYVAANGGILALLNGSAGKAGYDALLQNARLEKSALDQLLAAVRKQIDDAAIVSREGDNWYASAKNSLNKKDPDGASSFLDKADEAYIRSQAIAYTEHAETMTDKDIPDLRAQILGEKTKIATATAQKALAVIDKKLNARDFLGASDALEAAQKDWDQTQTGANPSFEIRRVNIQNALQVSEGRDISRLDPKADVVNTFIKYARDAMSANRLKEAEQNVNFALAVAPNYGAAKVLALMIKKQTDPAAFQKEATAQIAEYMKMAADRSNIEGQRTAYPALLDYSKLDPAFAARTKNTILELEYDLKLKQRPATAQEIAESNQLVQRANLLQQQGTQEAYQQALTLLKQALTINRDNVEAVNLDGQIRIKMGSTALSALSPVDTQKYKQALNLYLSGAYQDAYDTVLSLWDDPKSPRNKTYGELQRLKKRCEVALNIS